MGSGARIQVLGVHRFPFDDSIVEGHTGSFCPSGNPDHERRLRELLREMLESTVLVEIMISDRDGQFDVHAFHQEIPKGRLWWQVSAPFDLAYLSADGERALDPELGERATDIELDEDEDVPDPPLHVRSFRVAFYLRAWDPARPLLFQAEELTCPKASPMPERLERLAEYHAYD